MSLWSPSRRALARSANLLAGAPAPAAADLLVLSATKRNVLEGSMPTADAITTAMARPPELPGSAGDWLGPCPRITRRAELPAFVTTVDWVWVFPRALVRADRGTIAGQLAVLVRRQLSALNDSTLSTETAALAALGPAGLLFGSRDWSDVAIAPYSVPVNGPVDWWQSGQACASATRDDAATGVRRLDPNDNPAGPNPPSHGLALLATIVAAGAIAVVAFEVGPSIAHALDR